MAERGGMIANMKKTLLLIAILAVAVGMTTSGSHDSPEAVVRTMLDARIMYFESSADVPEELGVALGCCDWERIFALDGEREQGVEWAELDESERTGYAKAWLKRRDFFRIDSDLWPNALGYELGVAWSADSTYATVNVPTEADEITFGVKKTEDYFLIVNIEWMP
jgi:hypothetical protein